MILNQFKLVFRRFFRSPLISAINLCGLALGIASAYLGLSYAWQEFSYDKSFKDAGKIYRVGVDFMNMGGFAVGPEYLPEYLDLHSNVVESFSRVSVRGKIELQDDGRKLETILVGCDSAFFSLFDFPVVQGESNALMALPDRAVISRDLALKWFGEDHVVGRELEIPVAGELRQYFISGVIDKSSTYTHLIGDLFIPVKPFLAGEASWYSAGFYTYFKLDRKEDYPVFLGELESIRRNEIFDKYAKGSGLTYDEWIKKSDAYRFIITPVTDIHLKSSLNFEMAPGGNLQKVKGLALIGLLILLVAIANYINLTTARSYIRNREIGIKKSLGVHRSQLVKQFIGESMIESAFVAILAIVFLNALLKLFSYWTGSALLLDNYLGAQYYLGCVAFTVLIGLFASAYPSIYLSAIPPQGLLKNTGSIAKGFRFRSALVVIQFAITTALLCGSMVIFSQLKFLNQKDLGFNKDGLLVFENLSSLGNSAETFRKELAANPMVSSSSFAQSLPGSTNLYQSSFMTPEMEYSIPLRVLPVDENFLRTMGIRLLEGEDFIRKEYGDSTVAIINESAKAALGLGNAIGADISNNIRVIGVVSDFHIESLKSGIQPVVLKYDPRANILVLRLKGKSDSQSRANFLKEVNELWNKFNPEFAVQYAFIDETFAGFAEQEEIMSKGILSLTLMALLIACLGLFGLTTFSLKRREKEISIRKVLGSSVGGIVSLFTREFVVLIFFSFLLAIPVAYYFSSQWLGDFAYRIELTWWIFGLGSLVAMMVAILTVGLQCLKAALQNPVKSIRNE
ncbi:MAG: ABC transporter permease [Saprospiraceae bacterium]|nr:ABC transporter permease [Saprospiraceae bacterium]